MVEKLLQSNNIEDVALGILFLYKKGELQKLHWRNEKFVKSISYNATIFFKDLRVWLTPYQTMYVSTDATSTGFEKEKIHFDFTDI